MVGYYCIIPLHCHDRDCHDQINTVIKKHKFVSRWNKFVPGFSGIWYEEMLLNRTNPIFSIHLQRTEQSLSVKSCFSILNWICKIIGKWVVGERINPFPACLTSSSIQNEWLKEYKKYGPKELSYLQEIDCKVGWMRDVNSFLAPNSTFDQLI